MRLRRPEIILISVIAAAVALAAVFVAVYIRSAPPPDGDGESGRAAGSTAATNTHSEPKTEADSVVFSYVPSYDDVPYSIIEFFFMLDAGKYDELPGLLAEDAEPSLRRELSDSEPREAKTGLFNLKKARLKGAEKLETSNGISVWRCEVEAKFYDGNSGGTIFFDVTLGVTLGEFSLDGELIRNIERR